MQPEMTPEDIETATFTMALRGYDKQEVEDFLAAVADQVRAISDVSRSAYLDLGDEMGQLLQHARDSADEMMRTARQEATERRAEVDAEVANKRREAEEHVQRARDDLGEEVNRIRENAEDQARAIIEDAQQRIVTLQKEEADARERIRALRLQLLEVTLRLQRFEVADDEAGDESDDELASFQPASAETIETEAVAVPADDEEDRTVQLKAGEDEDVIQLDERAEESSR